MGSTFLHTHVRTSKTRAVLKALATLAATHGLTAAKDDEPCDHDIIVVVIRWSPLGPRAPSHVQRIKLRVDAC